MENDGNIYLLYLCMYVKENKKSWMHCHMYGSNKGDPKI